MLVPERHSREVIFKFFFLLLSRVLSPLVLHEQEHSGLKSARIISCSYLKKFWSRVGTYRKHWWGHIFKTCQQSQFSRAPITTVFWRLQYKFMSITLTARCSSRFIFPIKSCIRCSNYFMLQLPRELTIIYRYLCTNIVGRQSIVYSWLLLNKQ